MKILAERKWTQEQSNAISARNGSILVSAAAGSGKTAVLVQRVIEMLSDKNNPCDADRLLVVTFTNAAASEMRERISAKISELLIDDPFNFNLQRQQLLMSNSHISTIHSFCNNLIREKFYKLGISPDFRICDSNEILILKNQAIKEVLEHKYSKKEKSFFNLVEAFSSSRDDSKLENTINLLYEFIRSHPFPEKWLDEKLEMYKNDIPPENTVWGKVLIDYAVSALEHCINLTKRSIELINKDAKISEAYLSSFSTDLCCLNSIKEICQSGSWDEISKAFHFFKFSTLKRLVGYTDDPLKNNISSNRQEARDIIKKLSALFFISSDDCREDIKNTRSIVAELFDTVKVFSSRLDELKQEKKIVDFGDLEHLTLKLLVKPTASGFEKTDDAIEISKNFEQVIVDEYQDTNEAQDMIFRAISRDESNMFMVGDVKQSIYRFRQAMPEIFLRRKNKYKIYSPLKNNYPAKIILGKNFRSRNGIINCVNFVFKQLMSEELGEINYTDEEKLICGASYFEKDDTDFSLDIIDIDGTEETNMNILEARHIAKIIENMVKSRAEIQDGDSRRPVTYKDFCILLRNANKHASKFVDELEKFNIPAWSDTPGKFMETPEIATIISLLRVIDNPIQDIPLLSIMTSPIFGFTLDEISEIRLANRDVPIYLSVKKLCDDGNLKCQNFIKQIEKYRDFAATMPSDKLINYIYEQTGYTSMVQTMKNGQIRLNNLRLLTEYARNYEASGYKGIFSFVKLIDRIAEQDSDMIASSSSSENANVVRIMSIHRSKGLEFPICIVANCSRKFNKDLDTVILHPSLGLGLNLRDTKNYRQYSTFQRDAVYLDIDKSSMSEELRILYVAMTRAKEKLIIITTLKNAQNTVASLSSKITESEVISPYVVRSASSFSDWIILCALRHPDGKYLRDMACSLPGLSVKGEDAWTINLIKSSNIEPACEKVQNKKNVSINQEIIKTISEKLLKEYKFKDMCSVPTKVSVSEFLTDENYEGKNLNFSQQPDFLSSKKFLATDIGNAAHAFLQFADLEKAKKDVQSQIDLLVNLGFMTSDQAKIINIDSIKKLLNSQLMDKILKSNNITREYRFTVNIPAHLVNPDLPDNLGKQKIVLQGAIDCIFEENGKLNIVDYKTNKINSISELQEHYKKQLNLYKLALSKCTNKTIKNCILYSLHTGESIYF